MGEANNFRIKIDRLVHKVYDLTLKFPKEEMFCLTSQLRRAILSVPANAIEGYARGRGKVFLSQMEIAYGSLAEAKYYLNFACKRAYMTKQEYLDVWKDSEEISKMLWSGIMTLKKRVNQKDVG